MASQKLTDHILIFEAANFRGLPKEFSPIASKLRENFRDTTDFTRHAQNAQKLQTRSYALNPLFSREYMNSRDHIEY